MDVIVTLEGSADDPVNNWPKYVTFLYIRHRLLTFFAVVLVSYLLLYVNSSSCSHLTKHFRPHPQHLMNLLVQGLMLGQHSLAVIPLLLRTFLWSYIFLMHLHSLE